MSLLPKVGVKPNSYDYETNAVVAPTGTTPPGNPPEASCPDHG